MPRWRCLCSSGSAAALLLWQLRRLCCGSSAAALLLRLCCCSFAAACAAGSTCLCCRVYMPVLLRLCCCGLHACAAAALLLRLCCCGSAAAALLLPVLQGLHACAAGSTCLCCRVFMPVLQRQRRLCCGSAVSATSLSFAIVEVHDSPPNRRRPEVDGRELEGPLTVLLWRFYPATLLCSLLMAGAVFMMSPARCRLLLLRCTRLPPIEDALKVTAKSLQVR